MLKAGVLERREETQVRNEPVQARSAARLSSLLDAAARVVDEYGYDRLTTAMVAERAGASIGTVYRYFPDRIAVLDALSSRAVRRLLQVIEERTSDSADAAATVETILDAYVEMYRTEPGFRVLRYSDSSDQRPTGIPASGGALVRSLADLAGRRGFDVSSRSAGFRLEVVVTLCTSLVHRAFATDRSGDERFITEASELAADYLSSIRPELKSA